MKKKIFAIILSSIITLSVSACMKAEEPEQDSIEYIIDNTADTTPGLISDIIPSDEAVETISEESVKKQFSLNYNGFNYYPAHSPDISFVGERLYYHEADINYTLPESPNNENVADPFIPSSIPGNIGYSVYEIKGISPDIAVIVKLDGEDNYLTYTNLSMPTGSAIEVIKCWDLSKLEFVNIEQLSENNNSDSHSYETYIVDLLAGIDVENTFNYSNNINGSLGEEILFAAFYFKDTGINCIMYVYDGYFDISIGFYADTIILKTNENLN